MGRVLEMEAQFERDRERAAQEEDTVWKRARTSAPGSTRKSGTNDGIAVPGVAPRKNRRVAFR